MFTRWGEQVDQVWVKRRVTGVPERDRGELFGATAATVERHPVPGLDPVNCTPQLGVPGLWSDRMPYFRMGFVPSVGEELQSEYVVAREHAPGAIQALRGARPHWGKLFLADAGCSARSTPAWATSPAWSTGSTRAARSATPGWRGACSAAPDRGAGRRVGLGLRRPGR